MSASRSFNNTGSVRELVAHYESISDASASPPRATTALAGKESGSDSGNLPPVPNNTPEMDAAALAVQLGTSQPALPVLTEEQAYGLIIHEAITINERLTAVQRYNMLVSLDPNSTDPRLAPLLEERRRRGIHLGEQRRPIPQLLTAAQVLARGINNYFVPSAPATATAPVNVAQVVFAQRSVSVTPATPAVPARNPSRVIKIDELARIVSGMARPAGLSQPETASPAADRNVALMQAPEAQAPQIPVTAPIMVPATTVADPPRPAPMTEQDWPVLGAEPHQPAQHTPPAEPEDTRIMLERTLAEFRTASRLHK